MPIATEGRISMQIRVHNYTSIRVLSLLLCLMNPPQSIVKSITWASSYLLRISIRNAVKISTVPKVKGGWITHTIEIITEESATKKSEMKCAKKSSDDILELIWTCGTLKGRKQLFHFRSGPTRKIIFILTEFCISAAGKCEIRLTSFMPGNPWREETQVILAAEIGYFPYKAWKRFHFMKKAHF